jgi:putative colanic acid biosynthesis glycosyltransferase WcaI
VKLLYVSQYFPPEMGAPAARAAELARHWVRDGHEVSVLTGFPNHPTGVLAPEYREKFRRLVCRESVDGIDVTRTWLWPLPNRRPLERMVNYASFFLSASLSGLWVRRPDVIIGTSPQLLVAVSAYWLARVRRVPFVFEVRDLWPESLSAVGVGGQRSALNRALGWVAGFLYRNADHIVVVTEAFRTHLMKFWNVPAEKISVVENGVEPELFAPVDATALRRELGLEGKFVVGYIGTLGLAHGLGTLVESAQRIASTLPDVVFLLVGEGAEKQRIVELARDRGVANIHFVDQQPREKIPAFISAADACAVLLRKTEVFQTVIPTKMLEFMACQRPVILGVDGQARQLLEQAGGGIFVEPENVDALVGAITRLRANPELRTSLGQNGRRFVLANLSRQRTARNYIEVLDALLHRDAAMALRAAS